MSSFFKRFAEKPILILLAVNILIGLLVFRNYGLSWDEPLFYDYGDALGYAYSPREWFSGNFDISRSFGSSGDDHKTRGPAYLLLAREPVDLLESFGLDKASAWHLINFLFFQLGVYFLYLLASRWMKSSAALAASAIFSWQPLLWGHAFINPKDPPFLVFFLAAVCLGFEMVDKIAKTLHPPSRALPHSDYSTNGSLTPSRRLFERVTHVIFPAVILGITTSIRVLGPLAGLLVFIYFAIIVLHNKNLRASVTPWLMFFIYAMIAILAMFVTWPYLWENPVARLIEVSRFMSDNPTNLSVLFGGEVYRAGELPRRYMPFMLATTLTEPVSFLFFLGLAVGYLKLFKQKTNVMAWNNIGSLTLVLLWLVIPVVYVLIRRPSMYDGLRHFLFILPPIFIFAGFVFEFLINHIVISWLRAGVILMLLLPGVVGIPQIHPYEYTYYNSFVGGTSGAFRSYETDYWLTCYKEAVENLGQTVNKPISLYVHREAYIAAYYADKNINVHDLRGALAEVKAGDYILVNTRTNEDRRVFKDAPLVLQITRGDAIFCMMRSIP
jgi:hypothetical protein